MLRRFPLFLAGCLLLAVAIIASSPTFASAAEGVEITPDEDDEKQLWKKAVLVGAYGGLYGFATKVGARFGLEKNFKVVRLESAYAYDAVAHVWAVKEISSLFGGLHRWAGADERTARRWGAWGAGFGSLTYMEAINGFMPGVRFDPLDPVGNALGAYLYQSSPQWCERYPWMRRFSLEFGYKDWGRVFGPAQSSGFAGNVWHDYPNGRFGLGYGIGPMEKPWLRVFASYDISSFEIEDLRNRYGLGVELKPHHWVSPWLENVAVGRGLLDLMGWFDDRLLLPGLYVQLWTIEAGPFTQRDPFQE